MEAIVLISVVGLVLGVAPIILRSNAVYMFFGLCAGSVLAGIVGKDATNIANSIITTDFAMFSVMQIFILVIVPILLLFLYRRSIKADFIWQIIPALAAVILCFMSVVTMLPYDLQQTITDSNIYINIKPYYGVTVTAGVLFSMFYFWIKKPKHLKEGKKHKK
jgi:hypothetical protein